ncbi:MAG: TRAP transporter small permease [Thermodesulfobacteriota bacterium]
MTLPPSRIVRLVLFFHRSLVVIEKTLLCLLLFSMIGLAFSQVVLRNFFDFGFVWVSEVLRAEVIWIVFVGASLAADRKSHLRIDILPRLLKNRITRHLAEVYADLFTVAAAGLLFWAAVYYIALTRPYSPQTIFFGAPEWMLRLVIPYTFAAVALRSAAFVVSGLKRLAKETAAE